MLIPRAFVFVLIIASTIYGQDDGRTIRPMKVDNPPKIDGVLDDPVWEAIEPITDFVQWEPDVGEPVSERTEVRICYDSRFLYFGVRAYFSDPSKLTARVYERDTLAIDDDDSFSIGIDSLNDDRSGYGFDTNALGAQLDLQVVDTGGGDEGFNLDWDGIWYSKGNIDDQGYTQEIAIPFFILRFKQADEVEMGIIFERIVRHRAEKSYWPALDRDHNFGNVNLWGRMVGLKGIERGTDLEVIPYGLAGYSKVLDKGEGTLDAGADVKWGVTSNLTADFTVNTDFAQVESDALQINLTRFNLFYPEKRDFFLERADIFEFGGEDTQIFFSRRIGIRRGGEIPILGGARLYGVVGDTNVGLLSMQTREKDGMTGENFTVARVKQNIFGRSYFGGILTSRRGNEQERDDTYGLDFTHIFGVNHMVWGTLATSRRQNVTKDNWFFNAGAAYNTDLLSAEIVYSDVGPNFDPGIGFVERNDMREIFLMGSYKPRPKWGGIRQLFFTNMFFRVYNYDGDMETQEIHSHFQMLFHSSDNIEIGVEHMDELVPYSFSIAPDVQILPGKYSFTNTEIAMGTARNRRVYGEVAFSKGGFYGGDRTSIEIFSHITVVPQFQVDIGTDVNLIEVPTGEFTSAISYLYLSYYFSPTLVTRMAVQYSSLFEEFVFNLRLRWIYAPGSEAWLVYDESRDFGLAGSSFRDRALVLKVIYNFNF